MCVLKLNPYNLERTQERGDVKGYIHHSQDSDIYLYCQTFLCPSLSFAPKYSATF